MRCEELVILLCSVVNVDRDSTRTVSSYGRREPLRGQRQARSFPAWGQDAAIPPALSAAIRTTQCRPQAGRG